MPDVVDDLREMGDDFARKQMDAIATCLRRGADEIERLRKGDEPPPGPGTLVPWPLIPKPSSPDPGNDALIDQLQADAAPEPKRCPHCGGVL